MAADSRRWWKLRYLVSAGALVLLACALAAPALCQQAATAQPAAGPAPPQGVPVTLEGDVLFYVYEGLGTLTPAERAEALERRLVRIAEDPFYSSDEIAVSEKGKNAQIFYRGTLVGIVTPEEAAKVGPGTTVDIATQVVGRIVQSIERYRDRRQPVAVRRAAILGLVATLLLAGLLVVLRRLNRWAVARLATIDVVPKVPGVMKTMVRSLDRTASLQRRALRLLRVIITVVAVAAYLLTIFDLFPLTRGFVASVIDYLVDPLRVVYAGIWDNIGNFIFIAVIAVLSRYLLKGLRLLLSEAAAGTIALPGVQPDWAMLLYKAVRIIVVAITAVMVYPYVPGSSSEAFKGIGLFAGALFTLGASGSAGNMIGGLVLTFSGAFHLGDRVKIGDVTGDVTETTLMMTRIRSLQNEIVTIPNSAIMAGHIVNYSAIARTQGLLLTTEVTIGYDAPWRKVHALLVDAALRTPDIVAEPAPFVLQKSLNDYHVSYVIWAYTRDASAMIFTHAALHQNIQDAFNEGGIEILSPAFGYLRDGSTTTIPAAYRPESYRPEAFKVQVDPGGAGRGPAST
jgi:small-conductance mechanosensitive channel